MTEHPNVPGYSGLKANIVIADDYDDPKSREILHGLRVCGKLVEIDKCPNDDSMLTRIDHPLTENMEYNFTAQCPKCKYHYSAFGTKQSQKSLYDSIYFSEGGHRV